MLRSLNEVFSELKKAGRGAGFPVGHAEDIAHAGVCLIAFGQDGIKAVLEALNCGYQTQSETRFGAAIPELNVANGGPLLLEWLQVPTSPKTVEIESVDNPVLLFAMALNCSKSFGCGFVFRNANGTEVTTNNQQAENLDLSALLTNHSVTLTALNETNENASDHTKNDNPIAFGVEINETLWPEIKALAAKTYVPASEESRAKGAGASINDSE